MKKHLLPICIAFCPMLCAHAADAIEGPEDRWQLADLYPSVEAWNADAAKLATQLKEFDACRGHLGDSATRLKSCLDLNTDATKRYFRLAVYAGELSAEDTGSAANLELDQKADVAGARLNEATSFMRPELLRVGQEKITRYVAEQSGLAIYRHSLDDILRAAPHTRDGNGEELIATYGLSANAAGAVYTILANADLPWPTVKLSDGTEAKLDQSGFTKYRAVGNRDDRKKVFDTFWGKWKEFERTFGVTFYEQLKKDTVLSKVRLYPDTMSRALDRNRLPTAVYDTLIAQTNANLPTLHRYFKLRGKMLGVQEMRYYDIYPPLVSGDVKYDIGQGKKLMLAAVAPLGDDYVAVMTKGLQERWMDVYPRPRKLSGAHMAGYAYDVHPYLLLNYNDDYESVSTLAHEWGHAMHSYLSNQTQPFPTANYATFIAEIASTLNEALLLEHMLKKSKTDEERLLYLGSALEDLRGTFFRQAMFGEFEREVHARVDKGQSLTGEALTKLYGDILRRYHGEREGVLKVDDLYTVEWAYIPHFYNAFYVYQYATSIAASSLFAEAILKKEPGAVERYLKLLRSGSSDYPYELVKAAGVDLASPAPYQAVAVRMNRIMDEIEAIQSRRPR
jgi:oligoendopeptidase F